MKTTERRLWLIAFLGFTLAYVAPARAQEPDDPFGAASSASAPKPGGDGKNRISFEATISPPKARRGQVVKLTITGKLSPGFHTYPLTQRADDPAQDASQLCTIRFEASTELKPLWPVRESDPEFEMVKGVGTYLEHRHDFTWSQDVLVLPDARPGPAVLQMQIRALVCDQTCVWTQQAVTAKVELSSEPPLTVAADTQQRLAEKPPSVKTVAVPSSVSPVPDDSSITPKIQHGPTTDAITGATSTAVTNHVPDASVNATTGTEPGLAGLAFASIGAAFAMLLTPCVFPMIPITVSFFLKRSESKDHNAPLTAAVYSLTIVVVLALAVLVLGQVIVQLANDAWLNLGLGALLAFFALSLFGMYEIELPSGLARFTAAREGQGGYVGAVFMALTFTVTSFTCTGPFLGPLLVAVKEYRLSFGERLLGALCYSGTFAAPFFVLALFPSLLKRLPKSGGWLNAVKVVMGFLELAAALKFVANTDLAWHPGNPVLFNYETVLCAWIALAVACGLYLLGVFRLPHDTPVEHVGVLRMLLGTIFLGLAFYMAPALWRVTPQGAIGKGLVAFLPLDTRPTLPAAAGQPELVWHRDYQAAWRRANDEGKLIFIDFTGQNCTNCRYNEKNVFQESAVQEELKKYVLVQLYTDFVPDSGLTAEASREEARRNSILQSETFGDVANPLYAVIKPAPDAPFDGAAGEKPRLKGEVLGVRKGLISQALVPDFERFLKGAQADRRQARNIPTLPPLARGPASR